MQAHPTSLTFVLAAGLAWLAASQSAPGQGTLSIRHVADPNIQFQYGYTPWDVDGDGDAEFNFLSDGSTFSIWPQFGSSVLAIAEPHPNIGGYVLPLAIPSEIGNFDYAPASWIGSLDPSGFAGRAHFNACYDVGCSGTFLGIRAYFGFGFEVGGQIHYGWAQFNAIAGGPGGTLESYAYNLTPGHSVFVGQVPEPSTWSLLGLGGLAFYAFSRHGRKRSG